MARKQHLINVHTSTNTTAPTGASLYLGEIAVQHTPNEPALWIKMGSAQTSDDYEKFIGETEIMALIEDSKILGSGYTYSGLSYVNSATTIADAYSALTNEMILNEKVGAAAINELNRRVNELSGNTSNVEEIINEDEEIIAGALNILSNRIGTVETQMTGDYIPITGYELASGTSEGELALSEEDTVNEAFGKLQKQMLDNEEAIAAGFNYFRNKFDEIDDAISHSTGVTQLSGAVVNVSNKLQALSAVTEELSATTQEAFDYINNDALPGLNNDLQALSASVESISAKTSGVLTLSLNGVEQGKYSPSASTTIDLEVIQEVTGDDVLLTGYELATGSTEEDLAIVATDTVNEAFGKLQKQNYDNEAVVAGALNDIDEKINELSGNTGAVLSLSASVVNNKETISALTIDLDVLSAKVEDDEYVIAQAFNTFNDRINAIEGDSGLTVLSASVVDNKNGITALSAGTISEFKQKNHNIPYVVQSGSVFTGRTVAYVGDCPDLDELVEGQSIIFWTKQGSNTGNTGDILSACTLNLQLSDGTMTGPKIIYLEKNTKVTSHIDGANNFRLTYHENATWSGVTGLTGWWMDYTYDANTDVFGYQLRYNNTQRVTTSQMYRYRLMFTSADKEHWVPANSATSINATDVRTPTTTPIDPFGPIAYYGTTATVVSGTSPGSTAIYTQISALTLGYSFVFVNSAMTAKLPVYLKCDVNDDGSAVIDATTPVTQTLPTSEDGKLYIFLGVAANATTFEFYEQHPVYEFKNGHIRHYQEDTDVQMILGSGYTYSGLSYVNSATSIADAYSALTMEVIDNEYVVAQSLNNLNERVISVSGVNVDIEASVNSLSSAVIDNEDAISAVTGDLNVLSGAVESIDYVVAQSLNNLNDRVSTIEDGITVTQNKEVYVYGIGGYDGTNPASASTLQEVIGDIETILASI